MTHLSISVVFPSHNGKAETLEYLESLEKIDYPKDKFEIIMVDNNSTDNSPDLVEKQFTNVKVVRLAKNYGPSIARNAGIRQTKFGHIFISDNDIVLPKNFFKILNCIAQSRPQSIIGAKIINKNGNKLVSTGYSYNRWTAVESGLTDYHVETECDFVPAAAMFFKKGIGVFDPLFKFYTEDADFCLTAKTRGFSIIYHPDLIVKHGKIKNSWTLLPSQKFYYYYLGKFNLILKHHSLPQKITALILQTTLIPLWRYLVMRYKLETFFLKNKSDYWRLRYKALIAAIKKRHSLN